MVMITLMAGLEEHYGHANDSTVGGQNMPEHEIKLIQAVHQNI